MNALTKLAMGLIGKLQPESAKGDAADTIVLPAASTTGGLPLMQTLQLRQSQRDFAPEPLPMQVLSDLLWSAAGLNRPALGGRTSPSALNAQEVDLYVSLPNGLYRYAALGHVLHLVRAIDVRRVTGYQDFVDTAPLDLIMVADYSRMKLVPVAQRISFAYACAGAMAQNVYLYCASEGLACVIRAWLDRDALALAMGLNADQQVLLSQTVGRKAPYPMLPAN